MLPSTQTVRPDGPVVHFDVESPSRSDVRRGYGSMPMQSLTAPRIRYLQPRCRSVVCTETCRRRERFPIFRIECGATVARLKHREEIQRFKPLRVAANFFHNHFHADSLQRFFVPGNLRFPGQYFNVESGWNHNGFRNYISNRKTDL